MDVIYLDSLFGLNLLIDYCLVLASARVCGVVLHRWRYALAALIGAPVLRLKSDYLAIATLGFAEILRAVIQWEKLGPLTNASNILRKFTGYDSILFPFIVSGVCIAIIVPVSYTHLTLPTTSRV